MQPNVVTRTRRTVTQYTLPVLRIVKELQCLDYTSCLVNSSVSQPVQVLSEYSSDALQPRLDCAGAVEKTPRRPTCVSLHLCFLF
jgi:hypothetical protein